MKQNKRSISASLVIVASATIVSACSPQIKSGQFEASSLISTLESALVWSGATSISTGSCSPYTVTNKKNGTPAIVLKSTVISLSITGTASFFSDAGCTMPITTTTIAAGTSSKTVYISASTPQSLNLEGSSGSASIPTYVVQILGTPTKVAFSIEPSSSEFSGSSLSVQPRVEVQDASGDLMPIATNAITLAAFTDSGCTVAATGSLTAAVNPLGATAGLANFSDVTYTGSAGTLYLKASAAGLTPACSSSVVVGAGSASQLVFSTEPSSSANSGVVLATQPVVHVEDASGNLVSTATSSITLAAFTDSGCSIAATGTFTATTNPLSASSGSASFAGVNYTGLDGSLHIKASASGLSSACSTVIAYSAGVATKLAFSTEPSSTESSGAALSTQPVVQVEDASSNLVSVATNSITLAAFTDSGCTIAAGGSFVATTNPVVASSGVASFSGITYTGIAGTVYIKASTTGLTPACSSAIVLSAGTATKLVFSTEPSATENSGAALGTQPIVQVQDASNNLVSSAANSITLVAFTDSGCTVAAAGGLAATTNPLNASSGSASFSGVTCTGAAGTIYLKASTSGLSFACSNAITVSAGSAAKLVFTTEPSNATSGASLGNVTVTVEDSGGNIVTSSSASVTVAIGNNAGPGGVLSGTATVSASSGVATFPGLNIDLTGTGYTLTASSSPLTGATSAAFNITTASSSEQFAYSNQVPTQATPYGSALDSSGNLYVVGAADGLSWIVRKYSGGSWSTIDNYTGDGIYSDVSAKAVAIDPVSGTIYVVGTGHVSFVSTDWLVRKYSGGTWSTLDDYEYGSDYITQPNDIAIDSAGNLFVTGSGTDSSFVNHWLVREYSGGTWNLIDDYQYPSSSTSAQGKAIKFDSLGNLYVVGYANDSSSAQHWIVREYSTGSWNTLDDYQYPSGILPQASALTFDLSGNLYVGGTALDSSEVGHWLVREFAGGVWNTADDFQYTTTLPSAVYGMATDSSGNVYAGGAGGYNSPGVGSVSKWIVREYNSGSWSTIDDFTLSAWAAVAYSLAADSSGDVYATGGASIAYPTGPVYDQWTVRKYNGGSWTTMDSYTNPLVNSSSAAIAADSTGKIYAAGQGVDSGGLQHWIVRANTSGSWTAMDDYFYAAGADSQALAMTTDPSGNVYVAGMGHDGSYNQHLIVRKYSGGSWSTIDDFTYDGMPLQPASMTSDAAGNVYVAGTAMDGSYYNHWIVREYSSGTWSTIDDYVYPSAYLSEANAITIVSGNIFVGGFASLPPSGIGHWVVREYTAGSWSTIDDWQCSVNNFTAGATAIVGDSSGNVYVGGTYVDGGLDAHWTVRELSSGSWSTSDDYRYGTGQFTEVTGFAVDGAGNIYASGWSYANGNSYNHWIVRKYSSGSWTLDQDYLLSPQRTASANGIVVVPTTQQVLATGSAMDTAGDIYWTTLVVP